MRGSELGAGLLADCGNGPGLTDPGNTVGVIVVEGSEPPPEPPCAWMVMLPLEATATNKTSALITITFNKRDLNGIRCNIVDLSFRSLRENVSMMDRRRSYLVFVAAECFPVLALGSAA